MADAIQLLSLANQSSQQFYQAVAGTAQALERTATNQAQFQQGITEFNVKMAENRRVADANIASMQFNDSLRAQEHQSNMSLMPLKYETEKIRLEAAKVNLDRTLTEQRSKAINALTAPYDAIIGANFAKNQNPEYAQAWLEAKAQIGADIASGRPVDEEKIKNTVSYLNSQYGTTSDKVGYNPEVAQYLRTMGATTEAARYEAKNPAFAGNIQGLKGAAVLQGPQGVSNFMQKWGQLIDEKETTNLLMAADAIPGYDAQIESLDKQRRLASATFISLPEGDPNKQLAFDELNRINQEVTSVRTTRDNLFKSIVSGDEWTAPPAPEDENNRLVRQMAEEFRMNQERRTGLAPTAYREGQDNPEERASIQSGALSYPTVQGRFPQATQGIDMKAMRGVDLRQNPEAIKSLKNQIIKNLERVPDVGSLYSEALSVGKGGKSKFQEIFDRIGSNDVAVEDAFRTSQYQVAGTAPNFDGTMEFGRMNQLERWGNLGGMVSAILGKNHLESVADLEYVRSNFKGSEAQRELFLQDLYANMVVTDIVSSFQ